MIYTCQAQLSCPKQCPSAILDKDYQFALLDQEPEICYVIVNDTQGVCKYLVDLWRESDYFIYFHLRSSMMYDVC